MVKLKADFVSDVVAEVKRTLEREWGEEINQLPRVNEGNNILIHFFDLQRRKIKPHPRNIEIADDFQCPTALEAGWLALQHKVRNGEDLGPHLSTGYGRLLDRNGWLNHDGLLNEWGVYHFHLGIKPHRAMPYYIERDGHLVFALVTDKTFYAINVYSHGAWEASSIVESMHRNWPDVISMYRRHAIPGEQLTERQRRNVRKVNCQAAVATQDGTVYGTIGGSGVSAAGTSVEAVMEADIWTDYLKRLQSGFEAKLNEMVPALEKGGYAGEPEVEAELLVSENGYQVFFPRYSVLARLEVI